MQDYYNYIPLFGVGGRMFKELVSNFTAKGIRNIGKIAGKDNPELSKLISKLAKSKKGANLSSEESKKLVDMLQNYRRSTPAYQARRKAFLSQLAEKKAAGKAASTAEATTEKATEKAAAAQESASKAADTSIKSEVGNTLSARWKKAKHYMNTHPTATIGVPLLALGTGPGRYILGKGFQATQYNPGELFGDTPAGGDFVMINGVKIPIQRSPEGYFVPTTGDSLQAQAQTGGGDEVDLALAGITNENLGVPSDDQSSVPDQLTINDLFDDDQWL